MNIILEKRILDDIIDFGIELIKNKAVTLDTIISSDRLLMEIYCLDSTRYNMNDISTTYYKNENHIHDVIECLIHNRR